MSDIVERLHAIHDHDFRVSFLAHTADTANEAATEIEALRSLLCDCREHVASWAETEHMWDGFGPRVERASDILLKRVDAAIAARK